jgi:PAS domain S-box-containing protein
VQAQNAFDEVEARYHAMIDHVDDLFYQTDTEGRLVLLNPAFERMTGWKAADWLGKTPADLVHPDDLELAHRTNEQLRTGQTTLVVELRIRTADGGYLPLEVRVQSLFTDTPSQPVVVGIGRDISARQQAERARLEREVEDKRLEMLQRFVHNASHDFRTPLAIISSSAHLAQAHMSRLTEDTRYRRYFNNIESQVRYLNEQLENAMTVSALSQDQMDMDFRAQDINPLVKAVVAEHQMLSEHKGHVLQFLGTPDLPPVLVDGAEFQRLLRHLILNALSYTPKDGHILVRTDIRDDNVVVAVQDNGIGIHPQDVDHIFKPFFRVDVARGLDTGGMGLGLSLAHMIAEAHAAQISVETTPDEGSTFYVELPRCKMDPRFEFMAAPVQHDIARYSN